LLAIGGLGNDGKHDLTARQLVQNALADIEEDRGSRGARGYADEASAVFLVNLCLRISRRADGGRIVRRKDRDPVCQRLFRAQGRRWRARLFRGARTY